MRGLLGALFSLSAVAGATEAPRLALPDSEAIDDWASVAKIVGVRLVATDVADAELRLSVRGDKWLLTVVDDQGLEQRVELPISRDPGGREQVVWLGKSLMSSVSAPGTGGSGTGEPAPVSPAPQPQPLAEPVPDPAPAQPIATAPEPPSETMLPSPSQPVRRFGAGIVVGTPMGLSAKGWITPNRSLALEVAVGSPARLRGLGHVTASWAPPTAQNPRVTARPHLGVGAVCDYVLPEGYATEENHLSGGIRAAAGLDLWIPAVSVEVFGEAAPLWLPGREQPVALTYAVGVRHYFGELK